MSRLPSRHRCLVAGGALRAAPAWAACGGRRTDDFLTARTVQDLCFRRHFGFFKMPRVSCSNSHATGDAYHSRPGGLTPTSPAVDSSHSSDEGSDDNGQRRRRERGSWAEWNYHRSAGTEARECAELVRLEEPAHSQSGRVRFLAVRSLA